ncbi:MAG: TadE family protein [Chloroflexota bacterium]
MKTNALHPRSPRGQSLVEFAISLTAILILLAGAVDFGIGLFHYIAMRDAAQEGALFGSMNPGNDDGIRERVANASGGSGLIADLWDNGSGPLDILITYSGAHCEGETVTVTLTYEYEPNMPFIQIFVGDTIRLRAEVTDTILTPYC